MGTWGPGSFDNDAAINWLTQLRAAGTADDVMRELALGMQMPIDDVGSESDRLRVAAEIVVASFRGRSPDGDPDVAEVLASFGSAFSPASAALAEQAIERVARYYEQHYLNERTEGFQAEFERWRELFRHVRRGSATVVPADAAGEEQWLRDRWAEFVTPSREAYASICDLRHRLHLLRSQLPQ